MTTLGPTQSIVIPAQAGTHVSQFVGIIDGMNRTNSQLDGEPATVCISSVAGRVAGSVTASETRWVECLVNRLRVVSACAFLGGLAVAAGCGNDPAAPVDDGLRLEVEASPRVLEPGQVGQILIRLQNLRPAGVTLTFASTCQLLTYVRGLDNRFEFPAMGGHGCGDAITTLNLLPYEQRTEIFYVHGRFFDIHARELIQPNVRIWLPGVALDAGRYAARVELGHNYNGTTLRSRIVAFEVR